MVKDFSLSRKLDTIFAKTIVIFKRIFNLDRKKAIEEYSKRYNSDLPILNKKIEEKTLYTSNGRSLSVSDVKLIDARRKCIETTLKVLDRMESGIHYTKEDKTKIMNRIESKNKNRQTKSHGSRKTKINHYK